MVKVTIKRLAMSGREVDYDVDFEALVAGMDDEIRESVHSDLAPCTEQEFADEYMRRHEAKYGELLAVV